MENALREAKDAIVTCFKSSKNYLNSYVDTHTEDISVKHVFPPSNVY